MTRSALSALLIASLAFLAAPASCVTLQPGWPQNAQNQVRSSPALGDLDGDGKLEVIVGSDDWHVYAWHHDGTPVAGWPQTVGGEVPSSPVLGDIDGDGNLEVVAGCSDGKVYAWHRHGGIVTGWPKNVGSPVFGAPALGDLFGDGDLEVVAGCWNGQIYAWYGDGTPVAGWPQGAGGGTHEQPYEPALGDLDGDGDVEVVVGSEDENVYAWHGSGGRVAGWPRSTNGGIHGSPALGDLDGDGGLEVLVCTDNGEVCAWHGDGSAVPGWPKDYVGPSLNGSPALGDIDGDGSLEVVVGSDDSRVYAWHGNGTLVTGWPQRTGNYVQSSPALGDIDGDGGLEVVVGSTDYKVYAWHGNGTAVAGWPQSTGFYVESSPAVADLDGDGDVEVVVGSCDHYVYAWTCDTPTADRLPWPMFRHDATRSGLYGGPPNLPAIRGRLTGHVQAADLSTPVAGATINAYLADALQASVVTGADGAYAIPGLAPGAYTVTAQEVYYATQTATAVTVTAGQATSLDFDLEPAGRIMGQVRRRGTGTGIPNATVTAYLHGQPVAVTTSTLPWGVYQLELPTPSSNYIIAAAYPGYITQTKWPVTAILGQTTYVNFGLELAPPLLKGQVRNRVTGQSLIGARVTLYQGGVYVSYTLTRAPYGTYEFGIGLTPGIYSLVASTPGYIPQGKRDIATTEVATTYVNFNLAAGQVPALKGQVTDRATGAPIIGATVVVRTYGLVRATATTTAPWGIYEIPGYFAEYNRYALEASSAGFDPQSRNHISVIPGLTTYVNFFLQAH